MIYTYRYGDFYLFIEGLESFKSILWILCINKARGKENTCYVLCVAPGWEVSLLSINVCLLFMNNLTKYVTNLVSKCHFVELDRVKLCSCFSYSVVILFLEHHGFIW